MGEFDHIDAMADPNETAVLYAESIVDALAKELGTQSAEGQIISALVAAMDDVPDTSLPHVFYKLQQPDRMRDALMPGERVLDIIRDSSRQILSRFVQGVDGSEGRSSEPCDAPGVATLVRRGARGMMHGRFEVRERTAENALRRVASARSLLADKPPSVVTNNLRGVELVEIIEGLAVDIPAENAVLAKVRPWVDYELVSFTGYSEEIIRRQKEIILSGFISKHGDSERGPRIVRNAERLAGAPSERIAVVVVDRMRNERTSLFPGFQAGAECWQAYSLAAQLDPDRVRAAFRNQDDAILPARFRDLLVNARYPSLSEVEREAGQLAEHALFWEVVNNPGYHSAEMRGVRNAVQAAGVYLVRNSKEFGLLPDVEPEHPMDFFGG